MTHLQSVSEVYLEPGDYWFGEGHVRVGTLLGSCVSVTLWHPRRHCGGMCHIMLPTRGAPAPKLDGKYADEAIQLFAHSAAKSGTRLTEYQVKIFGGGNMFPDQEKVVAMDIGARNISQVRDLLKSHGLGVNAEHVGGIGHRKLYFDLWSGDVWVASQKNPAMNKKERFERKQAV